MTDADAITLPRFDHIGLVVDDLDAAVAFFETIGFEHEASFAMEGELLDRILGLDGARTDNVMMRTPDGRSRIELSHYERTDGAVEPSPANRLGTPHACFEVADLDAVLEALGDAGYGLVGEAADYENVYRLCYVRGPEGLIVELAQRIG